METVVLRLSYAPHAGHAPAFVARSRGGFEAEGLSVAIEPGLGSGHTVRAISAGEAHFGTVDAFAAMSGWLNGAPITSLLAELQSSLLGVAARVDAGIRVPGDLRGHSLGIVPQSTTAVAARAVMGHLGLRDGDVRIVGLDPGDDEALLRGSADAAVAALTNEYVAWRVRHPHIPLVAWPLGEFGIHVYGHVIITNHDVLTARRDLVARFVRAMRSGWDYALAHPADAAAVLAGEVPGLDPALELEKFQRVAALARTSPGVPFGHQSSARWRALAQLLHEHGGCPDRTEIETFYTNDFLGT